MVMTSICVIMSILSLMYILIYVTILSMDTTKAVSSSGAGDGFDTTHLPVVAVINN